MDTAGINSRSAAPDMEHSTGAMPCRQAVLPFYRYGKRTWIVSRLPCAILTKKRYAQCVMLNKEYRFLTNNFRFLLINNRKFIQNVENAQKICNVLTYSCLL